MKIILASGSPRRKELLKLIVPEFEVIVSGVDEKVNKELSIKEQSKALAHIKAKDVFDRTKGDRIIIGSDTIVAKNEKIYGKAKNREEAKNMLKELIQGDSAHNIYTSLAIIVSKDGEVKEFNCVDEVKVFLKKMTDAEIEKWLDLNKWQGKAGAYGIQDEFCVYVDKIEGNYTSVVGLPTHKVYEILSKIESVMN